MLTFFKEIGWLDGLALAVITVLVILGFVRGCSGELGRLLALGLAAAAGYFGFPPMSKFVLASNLFKANVYAGRLIVFIVLLVVCIALWLGLRHLLAEAIKLVVAQPFDSILGGFIGGLKAVIFVAICCTFGLLNPNAAERTQFQKKSVTVQKLLPFLEKITSPEK